MKDVAVMLGRPPAWVTEQIRLEAFSRCYKVPKGHGRGRATLEWRIPWSSLEDWHAEQIARTRAIRPRPSRRRPVEVPQAKQSETA